ncbi:MAG: nitric oxide reductase activation protein NorD [Thioalkalivibrionaceae bacterium]
MTTDDSIAIEEVLAHLEQISFVAHRDTKAALPAVRAVANEADARLWIETARDLFFHDRESGKSFIRHSARVAEHTETARRWTEQAAAFLTHVNSNFALEGFMARVDAVWMAWGESGAQRWFEMGCEWLERSVVDARAYFEADFAALGGDEGVAALERLIRPAETLFQERGLTLDCYLAGAPIARNLVGDDGLLAWARRGADLLAAGRSRGEAYFRLESEESMRLLLEALPGFRPRAHSRFLKLVVLAWMGAEIPLADAAWKPNDGRPLAETDGRRIFLPTVMPDRKTAIVAVQHIAGHLAFDSYSNEALMSLFENAGVTPPSLDDVPESERRITWRPLFAPFKEQMFRFQVLFDLAEDFRVNALLATRIPGFLERLITLEEDALREARLASEPNSRDPGADVAKPYRVLALAAYRRLLAERDGSAQAPSAGQRHVAAFEELFALTRPGARPLDAWCWAERVFASGSLPLPTGEVEAPELDAQTRRDAYLPGLSMNAALAVYPAPRRDGSLADFRDHDAHDAQRFVREKQEEAPQQAPEGAQKDPDADIQLPQQNTSGSGGRIGVGIPQPAQVKKRGARYEPNTSGIAYPEWDYREQRYIADWTRVLESIYSDENSERATALYEENRATLKRLTKALEMQKPERLAPQRKQLDGDELDLSAAIDYVAEKRAGLAPKPFIYSRRAVQHRDTAVLLLADLSTSIMARHPRGNGKIVDRIRAGLLLFAEAIERVGDPYALTGFASKQRDQVHFYWLKHFSEPLDDRVRARVGGVSGRLASRMGAAIRHAIKAFDGVTANHRLLLILSDGRPADYDDGGDQRYLHEDTRMAMKEALDAGVHPFCITLDSSGEDYLPAIFGPGHFLVLDDVDALPRRLPEIYLRLKRAA